MSRPHPAGRTARRFDPIDAAVLLLATWAGATWGRSCMDALYAASRRPPLPYSSSQWEMGAACLLASWTVALQALRLRAPWPESRVLMRRPGAVATASAITVIALHCAWYLPAGWRAGEGPSWADLAVVVLVPARVASAIAGGWMALISTRCWWPERGWVDRAGRAVAVAWFALAFGLMLADAWLDPPDAVPGAVRVS